MPKPSRSAQLDAALQAMLSAGDGRAVPLDRALQPLLRLASELRDLPSPGFKTRLKAQLMQSIEPARTEGKAPMSATALNPIREGFHTITPYLHPRSADRLMAFLKDAFGAEIILRVPRPDGSVMHAQLRIADSMLEMGEPNPPYVPMPAALHLYVADADQVYKRALLAGATSLHPLTDQPYGDREGAVRDPEGNNWYIATHRATGLAPVGLRAITPYLHVAGAAQALDFIRRAFDADILDRAQSPDGVIHHAKLRIGDSVLELGESHGQWTPMAGALHLYVPDTDALYERVLAAGGISVSPPSDAPYGDRAAVVRDPFGNLWYLATRIRADAS